MSVPSRQPENTPTHWPTQAARDGSGAQKSFLRMVSHELRTPLNSIIGFSEILGQEVYGPLGAPQYAEYAQIINDSGKRLLGLLNHVLDIVRLEGSEPGISVHPDLILAPMEDTVRRLRPLAKSRGVELSLRLVDEDLQAVYDGRALDACLTQLLNNAIDFTAPGDTVELDARRIDQSVEITVFNRGNAPDPADIARLMQPFQQGQGAHNRGHEGAGLGWAIVRLNCEHMNGVFEVTSRAGESLTATVRLPAA